MSRRILTQQERFWPKVDKSGVDECWVWTARCHRQGYGLLSEWDGKRRTRLLAHRLAWEFTFGPIPVGLCVLHSCDNPPCVNPAHLFVGTHQDNIADMVRKGRQCRGACSPNARLTEDDVRAIRERFAAGENYRALGAEFGIHPEYVYKLAARRNWAAVA